MFVHQGWLCHQSAQQGQHASSVHPALLSRVSSHDGIQSLHSKQRRAHKAREMSRKMDLNAQEMLTGSQPLVWPRVGEKEECQPDDSSGSGLIWLHGGC